MKTTPVVKLRRGQKRCCNPECRAVIPAPTKTCPNCGAKTVKAPKRMDTMTIAELEGVIRDRRKVIQSFADTFPIIDEAITKTRDLLELLKTIGPQDLLDGLVPLDMVRLIQAVPVNITGTGLLDELQQQAHAVAVAANDQPGTQLPQRGIQRLKAVVQPPA